MQNSIYPDQNSYPYGQFPFQYTKAGQAKLKEELLKGENLFPDAVTTMDHSNENTASNPTQSDNPVNTQSTSSKNNLLTSLMPLLTTMNNPKSNMNDMLKLLSPYVNQSGLPVTDLIKLMSQMQNTSSKEESHSKSQSSVSSTTCNIDNYEKVK